MENNVIELNVAAKESALRVRPKVQTYEDLVKMKNEIYDLKVAMASYKLLYESYTKDVNAWVIKQG